MLLVPTSILLRGNIWFIDNCVIKLHQRERRLRLQRNQGELTKDIMFVGNKQRALMEDNLFFVDNPSASPADATMRRNHEHQYVIMVMHHPFGIKFGWGTYEVREILTVVCFFSLIKLKDGRTTRQRIVRWNNNGHPILCSSTKIEEDMPGYGDTHRCLQKYKKWSYYCYFVLAVV